MLASRQDLDEDPGSDRDEIFAKIDVFFPRTGQTVTYETIVVNHPF